jgi:hypothetical protein
MLVEEADLAGGCGAPSRRARHPEAQHGCSGHIIDRRAARGEADLSSRIPAVAGALKEDTAGQASRPAIPERDKNPRADCSGVEALAALAERGARGQRPRLQIRFDGAGFVERRGSAYLAIENTLAKQNIVI